MALLDGGLAAVFGAAFAALYRDAVLAKSLESDDGAGGFRDTITGYPVKAAVTSLSLKTRAASGLPETHVRISVLTASLPVAIELDDLITVGASTYRIVELEQDPAGAAVEAVAVPV